MGSAQVALTPTGLSTQTKTIGSLSAGKSTNVTYTFKAPNYTKDTNITIEATVDPNNAIKELNESNNRRNTLTIVKAALPDLIVSTLTTDKTSYEAGETVTVKARVKNQGYSTAGTSTLSVTPEGMTSMTVVIPALSKGATSAVQTFTFTAPDFMTNTQVKITAKADASGKVKELNESNNIRDTMIMMLALRPDLTFGDDSTIISSYYAGKDIVIASQVRNLSAQAVPSLTSAAGGSVQFTDVAPDTYADWSVLNTTDTKTYIALGVQIADGTGWNAGYKADTRYAAESGDSLFGTLNSSSTAHMSMVANYGLAFDQNYTAQHNLVFMFDLA